MHHVYHSRPTYQLLHMVNSRAARDPGHDTSGGGRASSTEPVEKGKKRVQFDLKPGRPEKPPSRNCASLPPILPSEPVLDETLFTAKVGRPSRKHAAAAGAVEGRRACRRGQQSCSRAFAIADSGKGRFRSHSKCRRDRAIGETLFNSAVLKCKFNYCKLQLQSGANVNAANGLGQTPLMKCALIEDGQQRRQMLKLLLCFGADVRLADANGKTALHYAGLLGRWEMAQMVVANTLCLDLNAVDAAGRTPLLCAVASGCPHTVRTIVRALAAFALSPDVTDPTGVTPFILARRLGYTEIADILQYEGGASVYQSDDKYFRCADQWSYLAAKSCARQRSRHHSVPPPLPPLALRSS